MIRLITDIKKNKTGKQNDPGDRSQAQPASFPSDDNTSHQSGGRSGLFAWQRTGLRMPGKPSALFSRHIGPRSNGSADQPNMANLAVYKQVDYADVGQGPLELPEASASPAPVFEPAPALDRESEYEPALEQQLDLEQELDLEQASEPLPTSGPDSQRAGARAASLLPMTVIGGGLTGLCILAVLNAGTPVSQSDSQGAVAAAESDTREVVDGTSAVPASKVSELSQAPAAQMPPMPPVPGDARSRVIPPVANAIAVTDPVKVASTEPAPVFQAGSSARTGAAPVKTSTAPPVPAPSTSSPSDAATAALNATRNATLNAASGAGIERPVTAGRPRVSEPPAVPEAVVEAMRQKAIIVEQTTEQLQELRGENKRLKEMMAELEHETLNLNSELLQLELSLAEASERSQPRQVVETRTVYNFVNVPVGGGVQPASDINQSLPPMPSGPSQAPDTFVDNQLPQGLPAGSGSAPEPIYDPSVVADMPPPEMGWSPDGQASPPMPAMYDPNFDVYSAAAELGIDLSDLPPGVDPAVLAREMEEFYRYGGGQGALPPPDDLRGIPMVQ